MRRVNLDVVRDNALKSFVNVTSSQIASIDQMNSTATEVNKDMQYFTESLIKVKLHFYSGTLF